jgi:hypothetical protein
LPQGKDLLSVAASPSKVVAIGTEGTLLVKEGGRSWEKVAATLGNTKLESSFANHAAVVWTGTQFVAAGLLGNNLISSQDGRSWTLIGAVPKLTPPEVPGFWRKQDGGFAAIDKLHSQSGTIIAFNNRHAETYSRSGDGGKSWQRLPTPWIKKWVQAGKPGGNDGSGIQVASTAGKGVFVVLLDTGEFYVSSDGLEWDVAAVPFSAPRSDYSYGRNFYDWSVAVSDSGFLAQGWDWPSYDQTRANIWLRSNDGRNWEPAAFAPGEELEFSGELLPSVGGKFVVDSGDKLYLSEDGRDWSEARTTYPGGQILNGAATTAQGETYVVGRGGRLARVLPGSLQLEVQNYIGTKHHPLERVTVAGAGNYFLAVERQWSGRPSRAIESFDGVMFTSRDYEFAPAEWEAQAVAKIGSNVVRAERQATSGGDGPAAFRFASTADGRTWQQLGEHAFEEDFLASLTGAPDGPYLAVLVSSINNENGQESRAQLYGSTDWETWSPVALEALGNFRQSTPISLQWDGNKFLLPDHSGGLHTSADGLAWTTLPPLPKDAKSPYWSTDPQAKDNFVWSYASNGQCVVARIAKRAEEGYWYVTVNPLAVFEKGKWKIYRTRGAVFGGQGNVVWTGRAFVTGESGDQGGLRSSKNGKTWAVRENGEGQGLLCWTGSQMVGITDNFGILTHPSGEVDPAAK